MTNERRVKSAISVIALIATVILIGSSIPAAHADPLSSIKDLDQAYVRIAEKVSPTVVRVSSTKVASTSDDEGMEQFFKQFPFSRSASKCPRSFTARGGGRPAWDRDSSFLPTV